MSEAPLALAQRALEAVRPGDGAQAAVTAERSLMLRFAASRPTQATALDDLTVQVTVVRDGHAASAATNRTDPEALAECGRSAVRAAEAAARGGTGAFPGLPDPVPLRGHDGHDPDTARLDAEAGGAALRAAFAVGEARGAEMHGVWTAGEVTAAIASSSGIAVTDRVTDAFSKVTAIAPSGRSGFAAGTGIALARIDLGALSERASAKALFPGEPVQLEPGEYPVVFEAHAIGDLLGWLGRLAFNGQAFVEGRSALEGRLGSRVAAATLNLSDSPRYPGTLPRAFDAEGVPKAPVPLIQDGVAQRVVHDRLSASQAGTVSTGHALSPGGGSEGPSPSNLVLVGGGGADEAALCRPIERGVYVTRLWYTNAVRPKETLITGVTRDGTFLIEDGEITRPLADLRLTDRALGVFERVQDLTARPVLTSEGEFYGRRHATGVVCPAARVAAVRFSG